MIRSIPIIPFLNKAVHAPALYNVPGRAIRFLERLQFGSVGPLRAIMPLPAYSHYEEDSLPSLLERCASHPFAERTHVLSERLAESLERQLEAGDADFPALTSLEERRIQEGYARLTAAQILSAERLWTPVKGILDGLRTIYGLPLCLETERSIFMSLAILNVIGGDVENHPQNMSLLSQKMRRHLGSLPVWFRGVVATLFVERNKPIHDFPFVITLLRQFQGMTQGDMTYHDHMASQAHLVFSEEKVREVIAFTGLPPLPLAGAYLMTCGRGIRDLDLMFTPVGVFVPRREKGMMEIYASQKGTAGELFFLLRKRMFLSIQELSQGTGVEVKSIQGMESNRSYPAFLDLISVCRSLDVSLDEALIAVNRTYYPDLTHPRLNREPIHFNLRDTTKSEQKKVRLYQKVNVTEAEELFFWRKRKGWSLQTLAARLNIDAGILEDVEWIRRGIPPELMERLKVLGFEPEP